MWRPNKSVTDALRNPYQGLTPQESMILRDIVLNGRLTVVLPKTQETCKDLVARGYLVKIGQRDHILIYDATEKGRLVASR